jgi:hypothetical protein
MNRKYGTIDTKPEDAMTCPKMSILAPTSKLHYVEKLQLHNVENLLNESNGHIDEHTEKMDQ